ncbi:MAG TPA: peptide ABC transporter substrate-binding protein [Candidatus Dormibacteraeota bacterium]|nr:peptide ABC transporter substrate-binding protein [Candidatus Dormibacteraeota bacterium]
MGPRGPHRSPGDATRGLPAYSSHASRLRAGLGARLSLRPLQRRRAGGLLASLVVVAALLLAHDAHHVAAATRHDVRILVNQPATFDPAAAGDSGTAAITAQLYETLTTYDASLTLQPALAASWEVAADGRSVTFHLRPNLAFSDGTPLTAADVVGSWLRIIDSRAPGPLAALMIDVKGARDHLAGRVTDPSAVGLRADGRDVIVDLERPGADFPAIVSSPTFGIVPPSVWRDGGTNFGPGSVTSGGYTLSAVTTAELTLVRNEHYWAGPPAITTAHLVLDIGGRNPVTAFQAGDLDYTQVSVTDAPWIPYDRELGPALRSIPALTLTYLGLDTTKKPFDDPRVRQALGAAVDWRRIVPLGAFAGEVPADSMVPPGIPGGGAQDWLPAYDPNHARQLLAAAGYPDGAGLPVIRFASSGAPIGDAIAADLERELHMHVERETFQDSLTRISTDPPNAWLTGWVADYVGPNDFLGVLLESGSTNNYGKWSSPAFDQAIADALATRDATATQAAYERALAIVKDQVPVVPLSGGTTFALSRQGLLGATDNGLGILRIAGMAWAQ